MSEKPKRIPLGYGKGSLEWLDSQQWGWHGWLEVDGVKVRRHIALGTDLVSVARAKAEQVRTGGRLPEPAAAQAPETFAEAALRIVERQKAEGKVVWKQRLARLERYIFPAFGQLRVDHVRAEHIREMLFEALKQGLGKSTLDHLRDDCSVVLKRLWRDDRIKENCALKVELPEGAHEDTRQHSIPTDEELLKLLPCELVDREVLAFAFCSRVVGGQRTSDMLIGADWENVNTRTWDVWRVYRPKTKTWDQHAIHPLAGALLRDWWEFSGRPVSGPLFPVRVGKRKGERRKPGSCFAERLREAFWVAGIRRPLPGYEQAKTNAERRKLCAFQVDTKTTRRLGAHDLRRAYVTAVNRAGAPAALSMQLAGHSGWSTHQRYIGRDVVLQVPEAAVPKVSSPISLTAPLAIASVEQGSSGMVGQELDDAPEEDPLSRRRRIKTPTRGDTSMTEMVQEPYKLHGAGSKPAPPTSRIFANTATCRVAVALSKAAESHQWSESRTIGELLGTLESVRDIDRGGSCSATGHLFRLIALSKNGQALSAEVGS